jgi:hypothetical protein
VSRVLVIAFSDIGRDARVERQIDFLGGAHEVVVAGLGPPGRDVEFVDLRPPPAGRLSRQASRAALAGRLLLRRGEAAYRGVPLHRLAAERLRDVRADLVLANDVEALPLACGLAGGAPVVFDAHEWAPAQYEHVWWWPLLMRPQVDRILRTHLPQVAGMMTVAPGIAERYRQRYGVDCAVVTNAAPLADLAPTPVGRPLRLLHHGGAQPERRLELMVDALARVDADLTLDLVLLPTDPAYLERLRAAAAGDDRVRLRDPLPRGELVERANAYDAGVIFYPPLHANLELSLPNKLFDFIQARLAVVVGPSPEMARLVSEAGCGEVAADFTVEALADTLRRLTPERVAELKRGADRAATTHCAERNRDVVLGLVDRALGGAASRASATALPSPR